MDVLEIEIKAYCDNHEEVIKKISEKGGKEIETRKEIDTYMNHPERDFGETDEALRLRKVNKTTVLTYKGPKVSKRAKTRYEEEVEVKEYAAMKEILERVGFREFGTVTKIRTLYKINDIEICLDKIENLGLFVELEKKGAKKEIIEKELFMLADELGLDNFETKSYLELIKENI